MRINALITEQPIKLDGLQDILSKLNIGDVIKAKVLEMTSGELLLKLFDGTVIKASTATEIDTSPGSQLELEVKGKVDGRLVLETVKDENEKSGILNDELKIILNELKIKPDAKSIDLAGEIRSSGLKVTRDLLNKASEMLEKFSVLTPDKAVFLSSKNIKTEPENINTLTKLMEGSLKLGSQLDELLDVVSAINMDNTVDNDSRNLITAKKGNDGQYVSKNPASIKNEDNITSNNKMQNKNPVNSQITIMTDHDSGNTKMSSPASNSFMAQDVEPESLPAKGLPGIKYLRENASNVQNMSGDYFNDDVEIYKTDGEQSINNTKLDAERLNSKDAALKDIHRDKDILNKLIDSFKSIFVKTDSRELKSDLNVKQIYREIVEKLDNLKNTVQLLGLNDKNDITARINNIEDGINLLNQISNNTTYVQIPLNISGFNTTGELFVMKKEKSKKRIDPQNVVMLIALDTQNIGHIETLIDVKAKNVSINLKAEEQKIMDFIKENYRHLYNSLSEKGYRLVDIKYRLLTEKASLVKAELTASKEIGNGRASLDLKI